MVKSKQVAIKECDPIAIATLAVGAVAAYPAVKEIVRDLRKKEN